MGRQHYLFTKGLLVTIVRSGWMEGVVTDEKGRGPGKGGSGPPDPLPLWTHLCLERGAK